MSVPVVMRAIYRKATKLEADSGTQGTEVDTKQKSELPCEQIIDSNRLEESLSADGQQDLLKTNKESVPDCPERRLSTAKLETLGDEMEKSNAIVNTETLSRVEEMNSTASTEAVMKDK